jgi:hypothetical protein
VVADQGIQAEHDDGRRCVKQKQWLSRAHGADAGPDEQRH